MVKAVRKELPEETDKRVLYREVSNRVKELEALTQEEMEDLADEIWDRLN